MSFVTRESTGEARSTSPPQSGLNDAFEHSTRFGIETERFRTTLVVRLAGEFDLTSKVQFDEVLRRAGCGVNTLVLDVEPLTFIDCSGLHAVFDLWERSRRDNFNLEIIGARGLVRRVLHLIGLDAVLPLVDEPLRLEDEPVRAR